VKDPRTGEPTGLLRQGAIDLVARRLPAPAREDRLAALRAAVEDAHRRGVTSVQDIGATVADLELYDVLRRDQQLRLRVYAALRGAPDMTDEELDALEEVRQRYGDDPLFKTGAITLIADVDTEADLRDIVSELDERGWQVIIQAIGDSAVRIAREAVEYATGQNAAPERGRRHRVELVDDAVSEAGVQLAVTENASLTHTLDTYTREAAWASFDEHRKGSLERDMLADIVILTHDIFTSPSRVADADVAVTIFDGRVVYTRPTDANE
jgi:predicted amidohydrolase YtcJ